MKYTFPEGFLWGASTSAYQVEGGWDADGKAPSVQDMKKVPEGTSDFKVASDHYNRYKEDIALFKELGLKAYRFSISWTRVMPHGEVNRQGLAFYHDLIDSLIKNDIEPIVTVFHFDLPYDIYEKGGWSNRETISAFVDYCKVLFEEFGSKVKYWQTINEQNVLVFAGDIIGTGPKLSMKEKYQENHHMLVAQALVMGAYHEGNYGGMIGPAPNIAAVYAQTDKPEDQLARIHFDAIRNWLVLDAAVFGVYNHNAWRVLEALGATPDVTEEDLRIMRENTCDYIAFNYYNTATVTEWEKPQHEGETNSIRDQQRGLGIPSFFQAAENKSLQETEFGWAIDPVGLRVTANEIYSRYRLPLIITENGLGARDVLEADGGIRDPYRIEFLRQHIEQLALILEDGVELIGYCPWSALDLISTHEGVEKRYGFVYVNRTEDDLKDLKRYKKDSFYWYQQVIANNGL